MIFRDFLRALAQLPERRFRRVLMLGIGLTLLLLAAISVLFLIGVQTLVPDELDLPLIGKSTEIAANSSRVRPIPNISTRRKRRSGNCASARRKSLKIMR